MPEMPEVETVRRTLRPLVVGKTIKTVKVWYPKIITGDAEAFVKQVTGQKFLAIDRYAKYLLLRLSDDLTIVSHLRMEGKYRLTVPQAAKDKHDHLEFIFTDGTALRYNDVRKFGRMQLIITGTERQTTGIRRLGPEANSPEFSSDYFITALRRHHKNIKSLLLDQTVVAGLGNIYADEVLWQSQINPEMAADQLTAEQAALLRENINRTITAATKLGGTTVHSFLDAAGHFGGYQEKLQVYGHEGQKCPRCGTILIKTKINGRGTTYCPHCQEVRK
jgi:formamidopyrimidine-DNA glycosylase